MLALVSVMTFGLPGHQTYKHTGRAAAHSRAEDSSVDSSKVTDTHTQLCLDKSNIVIQMPAEDIWPE